MKSIIIINGMGGSGKDTFAEFCSDITACKNISSIDPVRYSLKYLIGEEQNTHSYKTEKCRKFMSILKKMTIDYNNYPYRYVCENVDEFMKSMNKVMFIHIREKDEITKVSNYIKRNYPDVIHKKILIINPNVDVITTNSSDSEILTINYDEIIFNDKDIESLHKKAEEFINDLFKIGVDKMDCPLNMTTDQISEKFDIEISKQCVSNRCKYFVYERGIAYCELCENKKKEGMNYDNI